MSNVQTEDIRVSIQQEVRRHAEVMAGMVAKLKQHILSLPDNPRINRVSKTGFVMSWKDLGDKWSADVHDFKRQYEAIVAAIERLAPDKALVVIENAIRDKRLRVDGGSIHLHPDVVRYLSESLFVGCVKKEDGRRTEQAGLRDLRILL